MGQIQVNCPGCKKQLRMDDKVRGKTIRCPACENTFAIPVAPASSQSLKKTRRPAKAESPPTRKTQRKNVANTPKSPSGSKTSKPKSKAKNKPKSESSKPVKRKKRRSRNAPVEAYDDPWDTDFDEYDDDFESYDDDFAEPQPRKRPKSRKKKSRRKSGGGFAKILVIGLFCVMGVGAIGGLGYAVYRFAPSLTGNNVVDLQYFDDDLDGFIRFRPAALMATPLAKELGGDANPVNDLQLDGLPDASQIESITMGVINSRTLDFGTLRNRSDQLMVVRLLTVFDPTIQGGTAEDHQGTPIFQSGGKTMWCPDEKTVVIGTRRQVTEAIDRGGREFRFRHFDFANVNHHFTIVQAEKATRGSNDPVTSAGGPAINKFARSLNKNLQAFCMGGTLSTGVDLDIQARCYGTAEATELKGEIDSGISDLKQQMSSNPMMAPFSSMINNLFGQLTTSQSGRSIQMSLTIDQSTITKFKNLTNGQTPF